MVAALRNPLPATLLAEAVEPYTLEKSVLAYLRALGLAPSATNLAASDPR
jgi:hypothetical protein